MFAVFDDGTTHSKWMNQIIKTCYFIVPDTNVFLSNFRVIENSFNTLVSWRDGKLINIQ